MRTKRKKSVGGKLNFKLQFKKKRETEKLKFAKKKKNKKAHEIAQGDVREAT